MCLTIKTIEFQANVSFPLQLCTVDKSLKCHVYYILYLMSIDRNNFSFYDEILYFHVCQHSINIDVMIKV